MNTEANHDENGLQNRNLMSKMLEQTMNTAVNSDSMTTIGFATSQMHIRNTNRRWVICLTKNLRARDESGHELSKVTNLCIKHQVNVILICFEPSAREIKLAKAFVAQIKRLSENLITPVTAYFLADPTPKDIETIMLKKVANFQIPKNAPLITETFM